VIAVAYVVGHGPARAATSMLAVEALWALIALASIVAFGYVERTVSDPIVPFSLFRNRTVRVATVIGFLSGMPLFGAIAFIPLVLVTAAEFVLVLLVAMIYWIEFVN